MTSSAAPRAHPQGSHVRFSCSLDIAGSIGIASSPGVIDDDVTVPRGEISGSGLIASIGSAPDRLIRFNIPFG